MGKSLMFKKSLIFDANNILYRTFFAHSKDSIDVLVGMCHHVGLWSMLGFFREYPADEIVVAFDDHSWRKAYTENLDECVTNKKYKGNRRQGLTESEKEKFAIFDEHVNLFYEMLRDETSLIVLRRKYLEADDLIAGYIQRNPDMEHTLISSDKDFMQLLIKNNLTIVDPDSKKKRSLEDWNNDPDYFMFEKCFRGDRGDNVMSAYPRVRSTKIKAAYTDPYVRENLMEHTFTELVNTDDDIEEIKYNTREVFEENELLMDLTKQPQVIRELIDEEINRAVEERGKFNYFTFLKFCGKYELKNVLSNVEAFIPLLSSKKRMV